jgi:hypothetical protein
MEKTNAAIEFARKHGMVVEEVGDGRLRVAYPSGESRVLERDDAKAPHIIIYMTCNLF